MEYSILGKSDLKVSRIGFGGMSLEQNNPNAKKLLLEALDGGINYFDTADIYQHGINERLMGEAFLGKRDRVILATKVGNQWRADGSGLDWVPTKNYILNAVNGSLKRLKTDYIDLYQLHGGTTQDPVDEIIEAFEILRTEGKIRHYGISSIRPNVIREYVKRSSIISVMMQYSLLDRRPEEEILSFLLDHQVGVLARGSVARGLLISKPAEPYLNYSAEQVRKAAAAIQTITDSTHSPMENAIHFIFNQSAVTMAVVGIRTTEQLHAALVFNCEKRLTADQLQLITDAIPVNTYSDHR